jgi:hypothetical protein
MDTKKIKRKPAPKKEDLNEIAFRVLQQSTSVENLKQPEKPNSKT